jgi:hypothetical protein
VTRRTARALAAGVACTVVVLAGCGGDAPAITGDTSATLQAQIAAARAAVSGGDYGSAATRLDEIEQSVAQRRGDGITEARADEIDAALDQVRSALGAYVATTTTTAPPTTTPAHDADEDADEEERRPKRDKDERKPERDGDRGRGND